MNPTFISEHAALSCNDCLNSPRLQGLEKKIFFEASEAPAVVFEMKKQVDLFREKLEVWKNKTSLASQLPFNKKKSTHIGKSM